MLKRSKHFETKFHFIRDKTEYGTNSIQCVPTEKIKVRMFTKSLPVLKVKTCRTVLMTTDSTQPAQVSLSAVLEFRSNYSLELSYNY